MRDIIAFSEDEPQALCEGVADKTRGACGREKSHRGSQAVLFPGRPPLPETLLSPV